MVKLVKVTKGMKSQYKGRKIELICYRCGEKFVVGDEVYKCSSVGKRKGHYIKLYCRECCFSEPNK
jgi:hypothetical protein